MTITTPIDENGGTTELRANRTNESPDEFYGLVVVKLRDGQSTEFKTQSGSHEEVLGYVHNVIEKIRAGEQPPK
jgi:hypothetical protein